MKLSRILTAIVSGAAFATHVAADEPRHTFECDTPAGHFSYWKRTVSAREIEVSGTISVKEMLTDKKWSPTSFVSFEADKPVSKQYGLRLYGLAKTPDLYFLELLKVGGRDMIGLGSIPATKDPIPFRMSLDASGLLKVTLAGSDASTQLGDFKPESIEISCSTGDFQFDDVIVKEKAPGS